MFSRRFTSFAAVAMLVAASILIAAEEPAPAPTAPEELKAPTVNVTPKTYKVLVVPIHEVVDRQMSAFVHRTISELDTNKYDAVIFEFNTPGGRADYMEKISEEILSLKIPAVAYVNPEAISAGAFIAMSTDSIYMAPRSSIGASQAYAAGPDGMPIELPADIAEKQASYFRAKFRALAQAQNYPAAIAEGMADRSIEVYLVLYDGKKSYMTGEQVQAANEKGKGNVEILETVSTKERLITLTGEEAVKYHVAAGLAKDVSEVCEKIGVPKAQIDEVKINASDKFIAILTNPQIMGLLILIAFGALWLEIKAPGFGIWGTISVLAFILVFGSQFLVGNASALEIILFLLGIALLAIELFVTPGFGVIGAAGIALLLISLVLAMQPFIVPSSPWQYDMLQSNLIAIILGIVGSFAVLLLGIWLMPSTPFMKHLVLNKELQQAEGYGAGLKQDSGNLIGQEGVTVTDLRPSGKAQIGNEVYSVVSEASFVKSGRKIKVISIDGPKIVVEQTEPEKNNESPLG